MFYIIIVYNMIIILNCIFNDRFNKVNKVSNYEIAIEHPGLSHWKTQIVRPLMNIKSS